MSDAGQGGDGRELFSDDNYPPAISWRGSIVGPVTTVIFAGITVSAIFVGTDWVWTHVWGRHGDFLPDWFRVFPHN